MTAPLLSIDDALVGSPAGLDVIDHATAEVFTRVPAATPQQLDAAVEAARRAAPRWAATPLAERQEAVRAFAARVREHTDELAALLTREQGKPLARARGEIGSGLAYVEAFARMALADEVIRDDDVERVVLRRVPVGVVAAITAWNYPQMLALWKIGPALVAGNPVIVKPSPYTPVSTLRLGELAQEVLPPGVLQVLAGGDDLGALMTAHPGIDKISFTGSARAGRAIMAAAADTIKRLTLELGGNDAGVVLPDAGSVWVNQHPMLSPEAPFGGRKQSGVGVESSLLGLQAYTDVSVLRVKR